MIDKTVLELVKMLNKETERRCNLETMLQVRGEQIRKDEKTIGELRAQIMNLQDEVTDLKEKAEGSTRSITWWADRAKKFEAELKILKEEKNGDLGEN